MDGPNRRFLLAAVVLLVLLAAAPSDAKKKKPPSAKPSGGGKKEPTVKVVAADVAHGMWDLKNITIVDTRSEDQYSYGHIPGAIGLPAKWVRQSINLGKPLVVPNKKDIMCVDDSSESAVTYCTYFATSGKFPGVRLYALAKGFSSWTDMGYPVDS
ncbi:hypothetical protein TSOC_002799 [Tetrabaena socialis]|uniref:Rhodanese domain-containing protein n=1 Tax=Tetrabaena socialis TaxID=47790 RepID=A0A2J8AD83_9CHLO|nr:hypothetical protein TSOC_002799 [Tetrabaena socialis]|eukprot:PNH10481.1 hypothetical protein TSOC_002799 [Tetrabaena socialis]